MSQPKELFDQAVQAARAGERERALNLFLTYVEQDEHNLRAWVWLSQLVTDPGDRITALQNALDLCPPDSDLYPRIQARLASLTAAQPAAPLEPQEAESSAACPSEPAPEPPSHPRADDLRFAEVIRLITAGKFQIAVKVLEDVIAENPTNERAWLLLCEAHPDPLDKIRALDHALALNPRNSEAAVLREKLGQVEKDPLKRGSYLEAQGEFELATMVYLSVATHSRLPAERLEANRRIEDLKLRQHIDSIQKVNPTVTLVRLTAGPVFLFLIMVFMQSGLNPLHTPLLAYPGIICVVAGSLLVSATEMRPVHPQWIKLFGPPGTGEEPEMRRGLRWLGFALLLAPYTMFLIEASHRLGELQASLIAR